MVGAWVKLRHCVRVLCARVCVNLVPVDFVGPAREESREGVKTKLNMGDALHKYILYVHTRII